MHCVGRLKKQSVGFRASLSGEPHTNETVVSWVKRDLRPLYYLCVSWVPCNRPSNWLSDTNTNMWPDLRKPWPLGFHDARTQHRHTFHHQTIAVYLAVYTLTNNSARYWCWKLPRLLLLWLVSETCQISTGAWVAFKWLHIPLTNIHPAVIHHKTGW